MAWSDNPELAAGFRHEAAERSASLRDGLLALEGSPQPRQAATALMRDAHTLKGSATMFGAPEVVELAAHVDQRGVNPLADLLAGHRLDG